MNRLVLLILAMVTLAGVQLPTTAAPARKHPAKTAEGPRSTLKTTGTQMDAQDKGLDSFFPHNYPPARLSIVDETCPYVEVTKFMFGRDRFASAHSNMDTWHFEVGWSAKTVKKPTAFKITMIVYDEFHTKVGKNTFAVPSEIITDDVDSGKGIYEYAYPLTRIQTIKAYISAVVLSDGTVWQAPTSTHHWAEALGAGDAAPKNALDPAIEALNLTETAKAAAYQLKKEHSGIVFTSGRRTVRQQAQAMASNISRGDRQWIANTYKKDSTHAKLQQWVDDHPEAITVTDIASGLEATMNAMTEDERADVSKHITGQAFDVQPVTNNADRIKADMNSLPGRTWFTDREGGLVRWHVQF